jgi:hypothetical protein
MRQSPRLLLDMKNNPKAVKALAAQTVDGKSLPAVRYDARDWSFVVMFDPDTRLPARIRTRDGDPIQGDSSYDLVLADWRPVGAVRVAHALTYQLNGRDILVTKYEQVTANPALSANLFEIPAAVKAKPASATGPVPYQWIIRRGHWGNLLDSDAIGWDGTARAEPELVDVAPGVSQSRGTTHNVLVVEMDTYLVVFDADPSSLGPRQRRPHLRRRGRHDHRRQGQQGALRAHVHRAGRRAQRPTPPQPAQGGHHRGDRHVHAEGR